jgi:hypothetical protein
MACDLVVGDLMACDLMGVGPFILLLIREPEVASMQARVSNS